MFKSKNKGFSLVELIVVIAILVVFAAILIPSLMQYTENSRAQKDASAMDEVVNAFQLALADEDCFDEMLKYSCTNNYLTYSDSSGVYGQQIIDGEFWAPDGSGRATTITFNPEVGANGQTVYKMDNAIVNDMSYGNGSTSTGRVMQGTQIDDNQCYLKNTGNTSVGLTYAAVKQTVGAAISNNSQTYRNSSFTVFIKFAQKDGVTVAEVYGQYNGTNVHDGASASKGTGTTEYDNNNNAITTIGGGTTSAVFTQTDLSGGGSFSGTTDYKAKDNFESLSKDHEFEFYSSMKLAADDINAGNIGANADCNKEDAVAGIYINNGIPTIVLIKDATNIATITVTKEITIDLNGHVLTNTATNCIKASAPLTILGNGGKIEAYETAVSADSYIVTSTSTVTVIGGTYVTETPTTDYIVCGFHSSNKRVTVTDAEIRTIGGIKTFSMGIYGSCATVKNSNIYSYKTHYQGDSSNCIYAICVRINKNYTESSSITNCNLYSSWFTAYGPVDEITNSTLSSQGQNAFLSGTATGKIVLNNVIFKDEVTYRSPITNFIYYNPNNVLAFGGNAKFKNFDIYVLNCKFDTGRYTANAIRLQGANGENSCNMYLSGNSFVVENTVTDTKTTAFISSYGSSAKHKVYVSPNNTWDGQELTINNFVHKDTVIMTDEIYKAP